MLKIKKLDYPEFIYPPLTRTFWMKEFPLTCLRKPQSGNHLACSVHGSSSASQLHSPPSQKKHLTLSEYPIKDEQFQ